MAAHQETDSRTQKGGLTVEPKKVYVAPVLHIYGSVQKLTLGGGATVVDGVNTTMMAPSDRKMKENIVQIGVHPLGIGLYLFDYRPELRDMWGHDRKLGVMADEVQTVRPEAVIVHADGYKMVDYGILH